MKPLVACLTALVLILGAFSVFTEIQRRDDRAEIEALTKKLKSQNSQLDRLDTAVFGDSAYDLQVELADPSSYYQESLSSRVAELCDALPSAGC